ncbi:MAG: diaminopimelate epimerase [Methylophilales bacterium]|jgi:diaminopimelate epimerase|nr:diaminopimelate epimerase [Methylophilales bacterium]
MNIPFTKMHGAGNDFIVLDQINVNYKLSSAQIKSLAHRQLGIGFDQLLIVEKSVLPSAEFKYRIFNSDGNEVEHCGNGARCFFLFLKSSGITNKKTIAVETKSGVISLSFDADNLIAVNMGFAKNNFEEIPFFSEVNSKNIVSINNVDYPFYPISIGNPHAVIKLDSLDNIDFSLTGKQLQQSGSFPNSVNVGFLKIINKNEIALKVYERGSGLTLACGTGACAASIISIQNGWVTSPVTVHMDGGDLVIKWAPDQPATLIGPAKIVFEGEFDLQNFK